MIRRGWGVGAAALAAAVLVTGCSGDPEPVTSPSPTPTETVETSASPTPTPSATALTEEEILATIPEAARTEDFPGAEAFARFFLENYQEMLQDRSQEFDALVAETCGFCANTAQVYADVQSRGNSLDGGHVQVGDTAATGGLQADGTWGVVLDVDVADMDELDSAGNVVESYVGGPGSSTVLLEFDEHWIVLEVAAEQS